MPKCCFRPVVLISSSTFMKSIVSRTNNYRKCLFNDASRTRAFRAGGPARAAGNGTFHRPSGKGLALSYLLVTVWTEGGGRGCLICFDFRDCWPDAVGRSAFSLG